MSPPQAPGPAGAPATSPDSLQISVVTPTLESCAVRAGGLLGLDFYPITVEVAARRGPSFFQLAGLAETAVREARIRLHSALAHLGITLDEYALTVNLAPAHLRKGGTGLDLALAVGILGAIGRIPRDSLDGALFLGEISLGGSVRPVPGVLPLVLGARAHGLRQIFVAEGNALEAAQLEQTTVRAVRDLTHLLAHLEGTAPIAPTVPAAAPLASRAALELDDVRGQEAAKRALMVAAAGGHHLLLIGPPGSGKSLLARRLPGLLPPLACDEAIETTSVHSVAGLVRPGQSILSERPFRAPHHTISDVGLVGGGSVPRPGEISLAHNGVLFLDELPEFRRSTLESLRQPLEDHEVTIVRSKMRATFPTRPQLVCAMNPCPCGNWGNPQISCRCTAEVRARYLQRISGPLLDRLDLHVAVPPVPVESLSRAANCLESTQRELQQGVLVARERQEIRAKEPDVRARTNAMLSLQELERVAPLDRDARKLIDCAVQRGRLSARGYVRVLRVARTIADVEGSSAVESPHLAEALRYRATDLAQL